MTTPRDLVTVVKVLPDQSVRLMARVRNVAAALLTQAGVGSDANSVVLTTSEVTVSAGVETVTEVAARNIAKGDCIFDTLQTDWEADDTGYNVSVTPSAAELAPGGSRYRYHLMITDSAGLPIPILWADRDARAVL